MPTITDIKTEIDTNIRQKTLPGTITRTNHAAIEDKLADEIKTRGVVQIANTATLDDHSHNNTSLILVQNVGFFTAYETPDPADNDITFESADTGWLWRKIADLSAANMKDTFTLTEDGTYTLADGFQITQINGKPSTAQSQKWGLTNEGEEIMEETLLAANSTKPVQMLIVAEGGDVTIYFSGVTASTQYTVYKMRL